VWWLREARRILYGSSSLGVDPPRPCYVGLRQIDLERLGGSQPGVPDDHITHCRTWSGLSENPHIKLADGTRRGYTRVTLSRDRAVVEMRAVDTVKTPGAPISTQATFVVEDGKAGALRG
jgi:hypothetical protein